MRIRSRFLGLKPDRRPVVHLDKVLGSLGFPHNSHLSDAIHHHFIGFFSVDEPGGGEPKYGWR